MAKPWDELHTKIETDDEFNEIIKYKGVTCERMTSAHFGALAVTSRVNKLFACEARLMMRTPVLSVCLVCLSVCLVLSVLSVCLGLSRTRAHTLSLCLIHKHSLTHPCHRSRGVRVMVRAMRSNGSDPQEAAVGYGRGARVRLFLSVSVSVSVSVSLCLSLSLTHARPHVTTYTH